jgi:hypothetical protein
MDNKIGYDLFISVLGKIRDIEPRQCVPLDDKSTLFISIFLCVGLVISYLPQVRNQLKIYVYPVTNNFYSTIELLSTRQVKDSVPGFCYWVLFLRLQVF